jgi:hypothetical protein
LTDVRSVAVSDVGTVVLADRASTGLYISQNNGATYSVINGVQNTITPSSINGLVLWLDSADTSTMFTNTNGTGSVSTDGALVKYWKNKAGASNNATWTTGNIVYKTSTPYAGNYPSMYFNGTGSDTNMNLNIGTVFVVASYSSRSTWKQFPGLLGTGGLNLFYGVGNSLGTSMTGTFNFYVSGNNTYVVSNINALNILEITAKPSYSAVNFGVGLGDTGDKWVGNICEYLIYDTALSDVDRQKVEIYLANNLIYTSPEN